MTRREMLRRLAAGIPAVVAGPSMFSAENQPPRKRLGIGMHSYGAHWKAGKEKHPRAQFSDALEFLEYAHRIGAGGVQVTIGAKDSAYARRIRERTEAHGMYFEGQLGLPKDESDVARFESDLLLAKEAGATVVRTALLSGRRYETFDSAEAFRKFREQSWRSLTLAEPVLKRAGLRLAVENHKDWLVGEFLEFLRKLSSEHVGICVDTGNSIALLEDPMEVVEAYAPFAVSTHLKDMAVREYGEGFLLSEVPLGEGFLNLKAMVAALAKANSTVQFNLEMITRDPLKVPCLTSKYWVTMESAPAHRLAAALAQARRHQSATPLPVTSDLSFEQQLAGEDDNVRKSLAYARDQLSL
jgi:3-oxoisoapionate decarboxylase